MENIMEPGLYCMDCMDAMKQFPDGFFDLAIVDPPYGINVASHEDGKLVGGVLGRLVVLPDGTKKRSRVHPGNPIIPSQITVRLMKGISKNLNESAGSGSFWAGISCWTIWGARPA